MKKVKKGWLIVRVSDERQADTQSGSLEAQQSQSERFIASKNVHSKFTYIITKTIKEEQSAFRDKNCRRTGFQELVRAVEAGEIDFVVFESLSRLVRDSAIATKLHRAAVQKGVELLEAQTRMNYSDPTNHCYYQMFMQKAVNYEMESLETSLRVSTKHREARVKAGKDSSTVPILGLDAHPTLVGKYVPNAEELKIVEDIMKAFVRTQSYSQTLNYCAEKGYVTKTRTTKEKIDRDGVKVPARTIGGDLFNLRTLQSLLFNPKYRGFNRFKDDKKQFEDLQDEEGQVVWKYSHGRVIDEVLTALVDQAADVAGFKKRPRLTRAAYKPLLRGVLVGEGNRYYQVQSAKEGSYVYYVEPISKSRIKACDFDEAVVKMLLSFKEPDSAMELAFEKYAAELRQRHAQFGEAIRTIEIKLRELHDVEQKISSKIRATVTEDNDSRLKFLSREGEKICIEIEELVAEKAKLENLQTSTNLPTPEQVRAHLRRTIHHLAAAKGQTKAQLIRGLVTSIIVKEKNSNVAEVRIVPCPHPSNVLTAGGQKLQSVRDGGTNRT